MNGYFITGTDTDIGKTALSALLLAELRRRGMNAAPMKPAQTRCEAAEERQQSEGNRQQRGGNSTSSKSAPQPGASYLAPNASGLSVPDLGYSLSMAQMKVSPEDYSLMSPFRFEPACSPHLAAELAGTEIKLDQITEAAKELASEYEQLLIEGAGGIMVPLNGSDMMIDLMKELKLPILLAARPGLGTINHTLLSIRALREAGLTIAGVVLVESKQTERGFIEEDNITTIERFGEVAILGTIPYCTQLRDPAPVYADLPITVAAEIEKIVNRLVI